jgi:ketosteroid isomerase-like protein
MKKVLISVALALAVLFACEKDTSSPAKSSVITDEAVTSLKSEVNKNPIITDQIKECLRSFFDGIETRDYDLIRSLVTDEYYALEQGGLYDTEGHIAWLQEHTAPPAEFDFTLEYVDVLVKGTTAWAVYYDYLDVSVGGTVVAHWEGLESGVFLKTDGEWKLAMMTVTEIPAED